MTKYNEIQNQFCSAYDKRKLCSYDIEFGDGRTKPLIHQTARFLYILQGKAVFTVDNKDYDIMEDSFIAILPWKLRLLKMSVNLYSLLRLSIIQTLSTV